MITIDIDFEDFEDDVNKAIEQFKREAEIELARIGELYVIESRTNKTYSDQTGNLRSANSYRVYRDGVPIKEMIGLPETTKIFDELKTGKGLELIVGNGMQYASFVEGKGFNVCSSGFLKVENEIINLIKL